MPLRIIGLSDLTRPFELKTGKKLGFDYHHTDESGAFFVFDCSGFTGKSGLVPGIRHYYAFIIAPPKVRQIIHYLFRTSKSSSHHPIQQAKFNRWMPVSLIWVRNKYLERLLYRIFENMEWNRNTIFNVHILKGMLWDAYQWNQCPVSSIIICF